MVHKQKRSKQYIQKRKQKQLRINVMVKKLTLTFMKKKTKSVEKLLAFRIYWTRKQNGQEFALAADSAIRPKQHQIANVKQNRIYPMKNNTQPRNMFASGEDESMMLQEMKTKNY